MTVTPDSLIAAHEELSEASVSLITSAISKAQGRLDAKVLGTRFDEAVELLACDIIAHSPYGIQMRLVADPTKSIYSDELEDILKTAGSAYRYVP